MKKVIYIPINKCANTTFKKHLKNYNHIIIPHNNIEGQENNKNLYLIKNSLLWNECFKFAIVRNPIQRFFSALNYMILKRYLVFKKDSINFFIDICLDPNQNYNLAYDKTYGIKNPDVKSNIKRHTLPMTHDHYCLMKDNELDIDYFLKLEELNEKFLELSNKIKINPFEPPPHINRSIYFFNLEDLSLDQVDKIKKYYEKDFQIFNYSTSQDLNF